MSSVGHDVLLRINKMGGQESCLALLRRKRWPKTTFFQKQSAAINHANLGLYISSVAAPLFIDDLTLFNSNLHESFMDLIYQYQYFLTLSLQGRGLVFAWLLASNPLTPF